MKFTYRYEVDRDQDVLESKTLKGRVYLCPVLTSVLQLDQYFLALDIIQALADLENAPKCLPGPKPQAREEGELRAFDDGYTAAVVALHARGYDQAALTLVRAAGDMGIQINLGIIDAYVEVSRG